MKAMDFIMDINVHLMMGHLTWDIPDAKSKERTAQEDKIRAVMNKIFIMASLKSKYVISTCRVIIPKQELLL